MSVLHSHPLDSPIDYPDDDGKPMANNSEQGKWIVVLYGNLCALLREVLEVYIAVDHLWYPVEGHPEISNAPDVMVVFGRPRGRRGSYKQWEENDVPVTIAFEVLSPANTVPEMANKFAFYEDHGVEEYYIYDPDSNLLQIFVRRGDVLVRYRRVAEFVSPRLGIRFDLSGPEMVIYNPDGSRFLTFEELKAEQERERQRADKAEQRAEKAQNQIDSMQREAEQLRQRMARLQELSRKARQQLASAEELQELERLENEGPPA
jgi:Uma2 family endonuclease